MKIRQVLAVGVLAGMFAGCVCPCGSSWFGDDEEGFVQLFNGKDLDGWSDMKHVYHVENGELVFTGGHDVFGNIFYHRPFTNFIARFEFKLKYHGNNGFVRDFVELPSQLNEHWAFEPEVLAQYAKHYRTGEIIPMELVEKLQASNNYGQGFAMTELVAAMLLDMDLYSMKELPEPFDVLTFEAKTMAERGLIQEILPRYRVPYFLHIFSHGYDVGYYSYMWANVLDCDAYEAFKETGDIFNQEVAAAYRREILSRCNEEDAMDLYVKFRGHEPSIEPLLKDKGLN